MQKTQLSEIVIDIKDIPALPSVIMKVNSALMDKSVTAQKVSSIIEKDVALTSKILRLANSSYYGLSYHVDTLSKAISVLGFNTVRNLAVTVSLLNIYDKSVSSSFDAKGLWLHSLGSAIASKALTVKIKNNVLKEKAFICGMLHDIGKLAIHKKLPAEADRVLEILQGDRTITLHEAEMNILGFTHPDVGALAAEKWRFPHEFINAIKYHHNPEITRKTPELVYAVHAGNEIAKALALGKSASEKVANISAVTWEKLGLSEKGLSTLIPEISANFNDVMNLMDIR